MNFYNTFDSIAQGVSTVLFIVFLLFLVAASAWIAYPKSTIK